MYCTTPRRSDTRNEAVPPISISRRFNIPIIPFQEPFSIRYPQLFVISKLILLCRTKVWNFDSVIFKHYTHTYTHVSLSRFVIHHIMPPFRKKKQKTKTRLTMKNCFSIKSLWNIINIKHSNNKVEIFWYWYRNLEYRTHVAFIRFAKLITDGYPAFETGSVDLSLKSVRWLTELGFVIYNCNT